ncbi:uncharacterized protein LOC118206288 [Anguilla anguilla]|uniref:uncharacterized protein LOC118206288 n=1 Tax=Anguilla anguilla TaxID=7936 RepID=UPI0015B0EA63|nr:uncharacterized protein LOC118206288 [Anguilla anguilla]
MSSQYYLGLPVAEKNRYLAKLKCNTVTLPDPFNKMLRQECFSTDLSDLPEVSQVHIFEYLVERECVYTREAFKAYRSLDAYNYFNSGKVKSILTHKNGNTRVVYGEIEAGQALSKRYSAWIVATKSGEVLCGHCTCMAGNGEVCSHVGTILVTVEQCVQDGLQSGPSVTSKPSVWSRVTKKADPQPVAQCDFLKPGKRMRLQAPLCLPQLNPDGSPKKLFKALKMLVHEDGHIWWQSIQEN